MQRQTKEEEAAALDMAVKRHREQQTEIVARFRLRLEQEAALEMAVNRHREQEEEEDAPASIELNANAEPLTLLTLVKSHFDTLVWAQLCNPQGVAQQRKNYKGCRQSRCVLSAGFSART